jgi:hypothetical protein
MYCRTVRSFAPKEISIPSETGAHCVKAALAVVVVLALACRVTPPEKLLAAASLGVQPKDAST